MQQLLIERGSMTNDPIKKENNAVQEAGLPEIAQKNHKNNPIILAIIVILMITLMSMIFYTKTNKKTITAPDEIYTVQTDNKESSLPIKPVANLTPIQTNPTRPTLTQDQIAFIQEKQKELRERLSAPLMIVNNSASNKVLDRAAASTTSNDPNTQFMERLAKQDVAAIKAISIGPLNQIIAEGSLIHAVLEPATNSDLPGLVRAIVSEPNYSEDGTNILIPRGSRLIGQYKSGMLQGQSRIFIVWTRLIEPSGISINISSPGVDSLGVAGQAADDIDRHFWERFGTASLLSLIGAGTANTGVSATDQNNSASEYRAAIANSFEQSANQSLQQQGNIPPTLKTYQGKSIMVFVAHDLNFEEAIKQVKPNIHVF